MRASCDSARSCSCVDVFMTVYSTCDGRSCASLSTACDRVRVSMCVLRMRRSVFVFLSVV